MFPAPETPVSFITKVIPKCCWLLCSLPSLSQPLCRATVADYRETAYRCCIRHCETFWFPWFSTGQSGETSLVVALVGDKTPFLTVILFVWIMSIFFLSEASHRKLIPLSVFHLYWNREYCFFLCNHKCFETCLIETLCLSFCRDFSNRNQQRQSWLKVGLLFSPHFGNYFVQKGWDLLALRKWNREQWERSRWRSEEFACFVTGIAWLDFY